MFDETLASRVARLAEAEEAARDDVQEATTSEDATTARDNYNVRKLALLRVEQALLIAGF